MCLLPESVHYRHLCCTNVTIYPLQYLSVTKYDPTDKNKICHSLSWRRLHLHYLSGNLSKMNRNNFKCIFVLKQNKWDEKVIILKFCN